MCIQPLPLEKLDSTAFFRKTVQLPPLEKWDSNASFRKIGFIFLLKKNWIQQFTAFFRQEDHYGPISLA